MFNNLGKKANRSAYLNTNTDINQSNKMPLCIINVNQIHLSNDSNLNDISIKNRNNEKITSIQLAHINSSKSISNKFYELNINDIRNCRMRRQYHRNLFSLEEDNLILHFVSLIGENDWKNISIYLKQHNFNRSSRQCKERYFHYLNPKINNSPEWTNEEDELLIQMVESTGKKWKKFEKDFPGRTEVSLRNRYNLLSRKLMKKEKKIKKKIGIMSNEFSFLDSYYSKNKKNCIPDDNKNESNLICGIRNEFQENNNDIKFSEDESIFDLSSFDDNYDDFRNFDDSFCI